MNKSYKEKLKTLINIKNVETWNRFINFPINSLSCPKKRINLKQRKV